MVIGAKRILTAGFLILCAGMMTQQKHEAAAEVVAPNLAFSAPEFPDRTPDFLYTGEQIEPEFSLRLPGQDVIPSGVYTFRIISEDGEKTSAGTKPGIVTVEAAAKENGQNPYYGSRQFQFRIVLPGDCNLDGACTAVDAVMLQKWLLRDGTLESWRAADLNCDKQIDARDLTALKQNMTEPEGKEDLKIRLTGSTADKRDEAFRRQMQDAVSARVPEFDFSQFTFETHGMTYLYEKNDAAAEIGKQFYFWVYYQDYLLDPEHYEMRIRQYDDGAFETDAEFLTADMQEKLAEAVAAPQIAEADAVSAAKEYAASLALPDLPSVLYQPSEQFGEKPKLLVYSLEEGRLAYQISDPQCNRYELGTGQNKILCEAAANVYVDAVTGEVLENRFTVIKSVS